MTELVLELIAFLGSSASLLGLVFVVHNPQQPFSSGQGIVGGVAICLFIFVVVLRMRDYAQKRPVTLKGPSQIKAYLYQWISRGQRVVIFSRDLSWVDDEVKQLLRTKAERRELVLCLPKPIPLAAELAESGADINTYAELDFVPSSRFTIINAGRYDAHVAIGRSVGTKHIVREFSSGQDAVFALANDLAEFAVRFSKSRQALEAESA